jgi:psp operon transcriptional activator
LFSGFTEKAKRALLDYHWPGNVRELKNVVERSVYRNNNPHIPVHDLVIDPFESPYRPTKRIKAIPQSTVSSLETAQKISKEATESKQISAINALTQQSLSSSQQTFPVSLKNLSQDYEINLITSALAACQFNQKKTAEALQLTYHQLRGYLKKYNLLEASTEENTRANNA